MNKTTKIIVWIVVIVLVIWGLSSINKEEVAPVSSSESIKVGVVLPLSGNFAVLGERMRGGFELAKEDIIKEGRIKSIDLIFEDGCLAKEAVSAAQKLIQVDKIDLLGGSFCVIGFVPMVPIFEQAKLVTFTTASGPDSVLNKKYIISTQASIKEKATEIAEYAYNKLDARTAAIIYYNTPLGIDYDKYLTKVFEESGGKVISSQVTMLDAIDFRTELAKLKSSQPDIIFLVQLAKPLGTLLKQAKELSIKSIIMGNSENEDPTVIATAGTAAEGFIISSEDPFPKTSKINDFNKRYEEKFGQKPDVFAANAYDALNLQIDAFNKCEGETECMLTELHKIKNYSGVSGVITIRPDGFASKPAMFKTIKNGEFVKLED